MCGYSPRYASLLLLSMALLGCGNDGPTLYPVTGKITINGQPAKGVQVSFYPQSPDQPIASSRVNDDGTYELRSTTENRPGAVVGKYKVVLTQVSPSGEAAASMYASGGKRGGVPGTNAPSFPPEYGTQATSPKEVEVKAESNAINIEI
jgi:hypothetical protein